MSSNRIRSKRSHASRTRRATTERAPRPSARRRSWSACCCRAAATTVAVGRTRRAGRRGRGPGRRADSIQRREAPDAATYLGKGKVEELTSLAAATDADVVIFDNDLSPGPNPQPGTGRRREGPRPHRVDPRHLRRPGRDPRSPAGRRTGPVGILHAAAEADVDAPVAAEEGRGPPRAGRKAVGRRPPPGRAADQRTAAASCGRSSAAASARWPPAAAR